MHSAIEIHNLAKTYKIHKKEPGLQGSIQSLYARTYEYVQAVKGVTATIQQGELVGFIGPNGAGKTTTLKMMCGLLHPTSGSVSVLGYTPWKRERVFLRQFSLVMGQKAQLWWDLPLYDSLLLQKDIYGMDQRTFNESLLELTDLLELTPFLKTQVRKLSLGQRMRGELAAAFIYRPKVLFLDEPTIGLDIVVQKNIRRFIKEYNKKHNATIILTSHHLDDVRELCSRLIVIDQGTIMFDGDTRALIHQYIPHKRITLTFTKRVPKDALRAFGDVVEKGDYTASILVARDTTTQTASDILQRFPVEDIAIEEPTLERVVHKLFTKKRS